MTQILGPRISFMLNCAILCALSCAIAVVRSACRKLLGHKDSNFKAFKLDFPLKQAVLHGPKRLLTRPELRLAKAQAIVDMA